MWWEILKRQFASTKGKTFQLDFNQPMIEEEEEDCKKKFQAVQNKLRNLTIAGLKKEKDDNWFYDYYYYTQEVLKHIQIENPYLEVFFKFNEEVPDEIYCKAIEQYEDTPINDSILEDYGEYRIITDNKTIGEARSSEEEENWDNVSYGISIYTKGRSATGGSLANIYVRHRNFYDGRYGKEGKSNPELDDKVERIIKGALVF